MKYLVVEDTGSDIYFEEFETLSEANGHAWYTHKSNQTLPRHCRERKYHVFVANIVNEYGDMDTEDNYFDSKTFYLPEEEDCFGNLWAEVHDMIEADDDLGFIVGKDKFIFSVPLALIENHHDEETGEFDEVGGEIIFDFYREAVRGAIKDTLAFYELD